MDSCYRYTQHAASRAPQTGLSPQGEAALFQSFSNLGVGIAKAFAPTQAPTTPAAGSATDPNMLALLLAQQQQKKQSALTQTSVFGLPLWVVLAAAAGGGFLIWRASR